MTFEVVHLRLEITEFELPHQPTGYDVLLGMDFLKRFHITMWGGNFVMSN